MTKLEELKAARDVACDAYDVATVARDSAREGGYAAYGTPWSIVNEAWEAADAAYQAELNRTKEQTSD